MRVTLDTNVFGPVSVPSLYLDSPQITALQVIRREIESGNINPYISEASMSLEGLSHADRIDNFIRNWASEKYPIELPKLPTTRADVIRNALSLGIKVLHAPRIALGSFYELKEGDWARDELYTVQLRQERHSDFAREFPTIGPNTLKQLGSNLIDEHNINTQHIEHLERNQPGLKASEMMWMQGIVAEFDNPKKYRTQKAFVKHVRDLIAEWCDLDILASHYAYGNDVFCTLDSANGTGISGILHPAQRQTLVTKFGLNILSPEELVSHMRVL